MKHVTSFDRWLESEEGQLVQQVATEVNPQKLADVIAKLCVVLKDKEKARAMAASAGV